MGSWAAVTRLDAPEAAPPVQRLESPDISVAVVDTNAIISGLQLHRIADTAVTIPEVLSEVRDKHTRQALTNLPFALECQQPSEESVKAVLRFARATGDLHSLSTADIRLISLAHTLQLARHRDVALKPLPDLPSVQKGNAPAAKELPGWNETGDKWSDLDKLTEEDLAEQELAGLLSKVSQAVQSLAITSAQQSPSKQPSQQLSTSPDSVLETNAAAAPSAVSAAPTQQELPHHPWQHQQVPHTDASGTADEWQKASSSHNAARKKKRKQQRRAVSHAVDPSSAYTASPVSAPHVVLPPSTTSIQPDQVTYRGNSGDVVVSNAEDQTAANLGTVPATAVTVVTDEVADESQHDQPAASPSSENLSEHSGSAGSEAEADNDSQDSGLSPRQAEATASASATASDSESEHSSSDEGKSEEAAMAQSSVASVTADFAMQNVILQMGLRLVAPNGMRIKQLSRWVLRCSACFKITKEPGRLFCPHCGNSTLDKVEAVIGPDGTEQYGVRKRFNTRGTRYSLPKPKGGSQRNAPILREDVLMQKLNKRRNRKPKDEGVDAFAPEYGPDSWFQKNHGSAAQYKGAAAALASWKHNPNERKHTRTNRRKK